MTQKDWILLIVPILCNGVVVFILQKIYEKRQLAIAAKQKYVAVLQEKVDVSLSLYVKVVQSSDNETEQINYLNGFVQSFAEIYYYYQQNNAVLNAVDKEMNKALELYNKMQDISHDIKNGNDNYTLRVQLEDNLRMLYRLLQKIQTKCINYKM